MEEKYIKKFDEWNECKKQVNERPVRVFFKPRDIWWCALGVNVGSEIDGKNDMFERPVLVIRRINNDLLLVAPLTTKIYKHPYRININISGGESQILLLQMRVISSKRLTRMLMTLSAMTYLKILIRLSAYILKGEAYDETPQ